MAASSSFESATRGTLRWITSQLIDGQWVAGEGEPFPIVNPATEEVLCEMAAGSISQVDAAVESARRTFATAEWADPQFRRGCLHRLADLVERDAEKLGATLTEEIGSPVANRFNQVDVCAVYLRWYAEAAVVDRTRRLPPMPGMVDTENVIAMRPAGVVATILAYNYPLFLLVTKIGAIMAAGCTTVVMPSQQAPLAVLLTGELMREAGFPKGAVNILTGPAELGKALTEHRDIAKVSFTGSVSVGARIMQQAAKGIRGVVLELGGKSAAIMLPGVDFAKYAMRLHTRHIQHAGQSCSSPTRYLVELARLEEFAEVTRRAYAAIPVGNPWRPEVLVGPVISRAHRERVEHFVEEADAEGAEIVAGGGKSKEPRGWFVNPTMVAVRDNSLRIAREEIFGPIGVLIPYDDVEHAVQMANDSDLGLKAYLFGSAGEAMTLAARLRVGTVVINQGAGLRVDVPMGGFKQSGNGREWGEDGIREFLESQHIDCGEAST